MYGLKQSFTVCTPLKILIALLACDAYFWGSNADITRGINLVQLQEKRLKKDRKKKDVLNNQPRKMV